MALMKIPPNSTLLLIGDSITDCGRARHSANTFENALGNGYVGLLHALLTATNPQQTIRIINMGTSGDTVQDLAVRWNTDVLAFYPDWLSIMIGINDVWRQFDPLLRTEWQVSLDEYASILERLVRLTLPQLKGLVLMTPYLIEPDHTDPMRAMMDRYGGVVRQLAEQYHAVFVDTQAAFDQVLMEVDPMALAPDRVHPNLVGHMILARAFFRAVEYAW